ncbi:hypothetical protein T08_9730 [Trichinella sp. T8]|nr:hypothetical protein T08_9730 [Trichinella sp. T8]
MLVDCISGLLLQGRECPITLDNPTYKTITVVQKLESPGATRRISNRLPPDGRSPSMSFGWFQQDQIANRSAQDTCRGLDLCRPCQPVTASEQLNDSTKGPTASWSIVVSNQHHVANTGLLV